MNNQYQQPDFELGWDDELTVDQEELVTLRPGEYIFTIIGFERNVTNQNQAVQESYRHATWQKLPLKSMIQNKVVVLHEIICTCIVARKAYYQLSLHPSA